MLIQDLKHIFVNGRELEKRLSARYKNEIDSINQENAELFAQIELFTLLADASEEKGAPSLEKHHHALLRNLLQESGLPKCENESSHDTIMFSDTVMTELLDCIPTMKRDVVAYVKTLRDLMMEV